MDGGSSRVGPTPFVPLYGCGLALYLGTLSVWARRVTADGYDGVGFVLALSRLDLGRWQPQPPGYPLLVLLGRAAAACGLAPAVALALVNAVLLGTGLAALAWGIRRLGGPAAGLLAALLLPVAPLALALALATLSDAAGLGALLLAVAPLLRPQAPSRRRLLGCGVAAGLALGVRPAYAPLVALLLLVLAWQAGLGAAWRVALALLLTVLLWLVPLAAWVGPRTLWALSLGHAHGHFTHGTAASGLGPAQRLAAVLSVSELGAVGPLGPLWAGLLAAALWLRSPEKWPRAARRLLYSLVALGLGYGLWVGLALPVDGHGRHVLPLSVMTLALLALVVGQALAASATRPFRRLALPLATALSLVVLWGYSVRTAWAFRQGPAPGAALADYVETHFPRGTALYGARAARQLDALQGSGSGRPAQYLGEVIADAERPGQRAGLVLVTSEVIVTAAAAALLQPLERFCYVDAVPHWLRLDHFDQGCVTLFSYRVRP